MGCNGQGGRRGDRLTNKPLVYIITINWNGLEDTLECLSSLEKINYSPYRIIVVDNGSENNQGDVIKEKYPFIELIENLKNEGFVNANNQGIEVALTQKAEYILLLNNDTTVKNDFLYILIEHAEKNKDVGILSPKILYYNSDTIWSMGGRINYLTGFSIMIGKRKKSKQYNEIIEPDFITGCAMLIKREVIEKIGLLDPIYFAYYEDTDYSYRARDAGYKIKVIPESIIRHKKSASAGIKGSSRISSQQAYLWARNGIIFGGKNLTGMNKTLYLFGELTFRLLYGLISCDGIQAIKKYLIGVKDGLLHI